MRIAAAIPIALSVLACSPRTPVSPGVDGGGDEIDALVPPGTDGGPSPRPRHERYIRGEDPRLVIELDYVEGALPRAAAESQLVARLAGVLDKPGGIEIVHDDVIASRGADHAWAPEELDALALETFDDGQPAGTITMHVMWLDGHAASDDGSGATLGVAWAHTHVVMYQRTIESSCVGGPLIGAMVCAEAQYAVWLHETGHLLGLVDNGLAMQTPHSDPAHGAHDASDQCVMYWAFDGHTGVDLLRERLLGGAPMLDFDRECLDDLGAVRD